MSGPDLGLPVLLWGTDPRFAPDRDAERELARAHARRRSQRPSVSEQRKEIDE